jgi:hypothetical protein
VHAAVKVLHVPLAGALANVEVWQPVHLRFAWLPVLIRKHRSWSGNRAGEKRTALWHCWHSSPNPNAA